MICARASINADTGASLFFIFLPKLQCSECSSWVYPHKKVENVGNVPSLQIQGIEIRLLQMVNQDSLPGRVHNPVFPDTCISVKVQLHHIIMTGIAWGNDLNNPVCGTSTAKVSEFVTVTDHAYVWLDNGFTVFSQFDSEGSGEHTTGSAWL